MRDADLYVDHESWNKIICGFVFKDGRGAEISVVLNGGVASRGKNNSITLMCLY